MDLIRIAQVPGFVARRALRISAVLQAFSDIADHDGLVLFDGVPRGPLEAPERSCVGATDAIAGALTIMNIATSVNIVVAYNKGHISPQ